MLTERSLFYLHDRAASNLFAVKQAYQSQESKFMIFSDSLSALQALKKIKTQSPSVDTNTRSATKIEIGQKEVVFMWVLGHTGICGNEVADRAAKEALENDLMPFSDLKPLTAKYI